MPYGWLGIAERNKYNEIATAEFVLNTITEGIK